MVWATKAIGCPDSASRDLLVGMRGPTGKSVTTRQVRILYNVLLGSIRGSGGGGVEDFGAGRTSQDHTMRPGQAVAGRGRRDYSERSQSQEMSE
jgi:hypothetical protein